MSAGYIHKYPHTHPYTLPQGLGKTKVMATHIRPLVDSRNCSTREQMAQFSIVSLQRPRPKTQTQLLTVRGIFLRMRVCKMGERTEIKHQKLWAGVICHCRRLGDRAASMMERMVLPHGSEFLITRVSTASGTHCWGCGGERTLRKNIHLEFFLFCLSTLCH